MENGEKAYLDEFVSKVISRKFLVWLTATILMAISVFTKFIVLSSSDWVTISAIYIGGQTVIDAAVALKTGRTTGIGSVLQNITNNNTNNNSTISMQVPSTSKDVTKTIQKDKDSEQEPTRPSLPGNENK